MQIYTRTGDKGTTRIIGGQEVPKDSLRVNAYGSVDELNSWIGVTISENESWPELNEELIQIQQYLFDCGNDFATPEGKGEYRLKQAAIDWLEERIDTYNPQAPAVESFILPGGSRLASRLHYARTVTRRCERHIVSFMREESSSPVALKFINRLSDYFFAVARLANVKVGLSDILYERSGKVFHDESELSKADLNDS
ncbi:MULTISPECIES: cob(I)yrinic acid a,c-diamide adenosyltransferase [Aerococcus]|uniref:cob(I)yrinic acid a,c-diamide adenosyltransferase n=1 Tax=Aerococcus TaxID=1375 RepID=UPI000DCC2ACA|nr:MULTISPECIES: cob(I)yrinic acid a,c-diamide adenosyltransferase [Aerococcus]KAA9299115.1 cob(I)yrinic acid a,c-diamide adenosyltransferase [Aerococcus tenax]MDK6688281.1 cob(I)yrinic acid a,c-diamide adenosyltransferase [Aerococcus urinae]MDK8132599.1 cob(I)yrinic acid a,c-diamide adenosyltransferase [Aerococcus urinae]MDK8484481.1 cob(I)yrinic acid a,c-diamide adenosyltransferase [Aerococcus urinae]MDL5179236.1 cob(I)yrinic acid a,c-diamide adenosyltransferase [Aerococcus tenax]